MSSWRRRQSFGCRCTHSERVQISCRPRLGIVPQLRNDDGIGSRARRHGRGCIRIRTGRGNTALDQFRRESCTPECVQHNGARSASAVVAPLALTMARHVRRRPCRDYARHVRRHRASARVMARRVDISPSELICAHQGGEDFPFFCVFPVAGCRCWGVVFRNT